MADKPRSTRDIQRAQRLKRYQKELPMLEERLALAERRDEGAAYIRLLERKIAHRRKRLAEGWADD